MSDQSKTTEPPSDDEWWEFVFSVMDQLQFDRACDRKCFSFACPCRRDAIARVARDTGVNYSDE